MRLAMCIFLFGSTFVSFGQEDTNKVNLPFPITNPIDPTQNNPQSFDLGDPKNVTRTIVYDPVTGKYIFQETIGNGLNYRNPSMMTLEEYMEYERQKSLKENWKDKIDQQTEEQRALEFPIKIPSKTFENFFGEKRGVTVLHEVLEAAIGAKDSPGAGNYKQDKAAYTNAHNKANKMDKNRRDLSYGARVEASNVTAKTADANVILTRGDGKTEKLLYTAKNLKIKK